MATQTESLDRLIAAVEDGYANMGAFYAYLPPKLYGLANDAYNGSLDAARALHGALLPGWDVDIDIRHIMSDVWIFSPKEYRNIIVTNENPARAWLLAILKAYRSTID